LNPSEAEAVFDGQHVTLRPTEPSDYRLLRNLETASPVAFRWRHNGQQIPLEQYGEAHWAGVHASFVFETRTESTLLGNALAYGADPRHGFCYVAVGTLRSSGSPVRDSVCSVEATVLLVDYLFQGWNFRKLYFEVAEYNVEQISSFLDRLSLEGRLTDHIYLADRFWDLGTWSLERAQWEQLRQLAVRNVNPPNADAVNPVEMGES